MRVALLSRGAHPLHGPGGMERAVHNLALQLNERGVETLLFTRPAGRNGRFPGTVVTIPYRSLRGLAHGRVLDRTLHYPAFALAAGVAVAQRVRAGEVDIVDAQGLMALGYGRLRRADPTLRAPLLMNPQGMEEHKTSGLKRILLARLRGLSREAASLSDRVIATDEATRAEVPQLLGVEASRVAVIPNGIFPAEIDRLTPPEPEGVVRKAFPSIADASPLLLSVGRLERYKGFGDVLQALRSLHERHALPASWAWVVVGEGPMKASLARTCRGLGGHVCLAGRVDEGLLHALYARADVFVHATRFEGSSLVTLEAMAHGLPVLATRAGGIPDKVVDGVTGLLVAPGDVEALGRGLTEAAAAPERWQEMGRRGRERAVESFSWPVLAQRTLALYSELLEARRT